MKLKIGQHVNYPGHGICIVTKVPSPCENICQAKTIPSKVWFSFYTLETISNGMKILVDKDDLQTVGIRKLAKPKEVTKALEVAYVSKAKIEGTTWNKRYRDYMSKLESGHVSLVAEVVRDLKQLKKLQQLSFGERKMLDRAQELLMQEVNLVLNNDYEVPFIYGTGKIKLKKIKKG